MNGALSDGLDAPEDAVTAPAKTPQPPKATRALEFHAVFAILKRYLVSPLGQWQLERFEKDPWRASPEAAAASLAEVAEAMDWLREAESPRAALPPPRFQGLRDTRPAAERLRVEGAVLEATQISDLLDLLDRADEMRLNFRADAGRHPLLAAHGERFADFRPLLRDLSGKILPGGDIADQASTALSKIRRQIEHHRREVQTSLDRFVRTQYQEGVLQEDYVTIRNGRLVVPVKANWKWRVEGVIHSASGSGQTVFIEPLVTIALNNRLVRMLEEEQREIQRILREMTERLRLSVDAIGQAIDALGELELLFAQARFGKDFQCCIPTFCGPGPSRLLLQRARHPLLMDVLGAAGRQVVPLSLELGQASPVLLISGPNAGGKTVVLKTVGLLALMAQAGLPVPADEAQFPWFHEVLADIGDAQSISESLSTFSAHIEQLKRMMALATGRSLVLIDELGAATDPQEGGALGVAVVEHFLEQGSFTLASTHLPALKIYAANASGLTNAAVGYDEKTLSPTYRLLVGVPGQSAGLAMARRLGVPETVIERAQRAMSTHEEEAVAFLQHLHQRVEEYEQAEKKLRQLELDLGERDRKRTRESEKQQAAKLTELERRVERLIERFNADTKAALEKLAEAGASRRQVQTAQRRAGQARRTIQEQFQAAVQETLGGPQGAGRQAAPAPAVTTGSRVRLGELGVTGRVVRQLAEHRWEVEVGQLRMRVGSEDISEVLGEQAPPQPGHRLPSRVTYQGQVRDPASLSEINVIGKTREEACDAVDKFLDEAVLAEVRRVRIIHGHGMNVLRRELWKMFAGHAHVERYYQAEQQEGGAGATIVEVRQ